MAPIPQSVIEARRSLISSVETAARDLVMTPELDHGEAVRAVQMLEEMIIVYDKSVRLVHNSSSAWYAERDLPLTEQAVTRSAKHLVAAAHRLYTAPEVTT